LAKLSYLSDTAKEIGSTVSNLKVGDHVGWGFVHSSCGVCEQCLTGRENLCQKRETFGRSNHDQGSFASYGIWKADYIFKIPETMAPEDAAPLMCGGATVFHVLRSFGIRSTDRVGVIGVGGLGHLAMQFASKMGCEVVVFSSTESKKAEALQLGASQFVATKGVTDLESAVGNPINHLIVTSSFPPDWTQFVPILAPRGAIYPLTVSAGNLEIPYRALMDKELTVQASLVAPRQVHREMIAFAARWGIRPVIERFPLTAEGITEAMGRLSEGKMRYRAVLVAP
jgi:D-arabinose 1-dehydrogenase-like Zn-dependent alcohol dehydrogenase